jgi:hypothetical protein
MLLLDWGLVVKEVGFFFFSLFSLPFLFFFFFFIFFFILFLSSVYLSFSFPSSALHHDRLRHFFLLFFTRGRFGDFSICSLLASWMVF